MINFRDMTIRKKLTVLFMSTVVASLLLACLVFYVMMVNHFTSSYTRALSGVAEVLASNCEASVAFRLPEDAERVLTSLSTRPSVVYASIRDAQGRDFVAYGKRPDALSGNDAPGASTTSDHVVIMQEIRMGGGVIGTLLLFDDMRSIKRMKQMAIVAVMLAVSLALILAYLMASRMQEFISGPIIALASAVETITRGNDFSLRAEKKGDDEVGMLVDSFNKMISHIESEAIERTNSETERRKLEAQLQQSQKMEAIGALAGGVAHDFNNILSAIMGYGSIMQIKMKPDDPYHQYVEQIMAATERAAGLTRSLLAFSRKQVIELAPVEINEMVLGFQKILARLIGEDIELKVHCQADNLMVEADKGQLEQILMNLVTNARDAMPKGGTIMIETNEVFIDEHSMNAHGLNKAGAYVFLTVSDTGIGMDRETQERIFEPFFTTKSVGKGTGLGLSIAYGIVKKHNGIINVYSEPGKGTSFKIYLPSKSGTLRVVKQQAVAPPDRGNETILLVEDNEAVRKMMRIMLEEFGYTVLEAADGEEAVDVFREQRDRIDLLLSDLIMPRMNGREAYEAMQEIRPDLKAIFSSGYTADIIEQKGIVEDGINFISKPVNPTEMLRKIRMVLGKK